MKSPADQPHHGLAAEPDLDRLAAALLDLALEGEALRGRPAAAPPALPPHAHGLAAGPGAAPDHPLPVPPAAVERAAVPGSIGVDIQASQLLQGHDPSLLSLDLLPVRSGRADVPAAVPNPYRATPDLPDGIGAPMTGSHTGYRHYLQPPSIPLPGVTPPAPPGADSGGYYFLQEQTPAAPRSHTGRHVRDDFPALQQRVNGHRLVWLDNGATTQKPTVVIEREADFYRRDNSNVHRGAHTLARRATSLYEQARATVARFIGAASPEEVVFVRGTTEGINLVAQTFGRTAIGPGDEVLISHLEHHSNIVPWQMLCREKGASLKVIPVDDRGDLQLDELDAMIGPRTKVVAITQVSNVTGTLVPISAVTALAHRHGAVVLVDGAQSVAHSPVNVQFLGADFFVFSGHKVYAPTGIGALYGRRELLEAMPPWQGGGSMIDSVTFEETRYAAPPARFEAGTGNIAGAVTLATALDYLEALGRDRVAASELELARYAAEGLRRIPGLRLIGDPAVRVGALSFVLEGHDPAAVAEALDQRGIAVRAGHHCAQPILDRFGLQAAVRASLGVYNEQDDIDELLAALRDLAAGRTYR